MKLLVDNLAGVYVDFIVAGIFKNEIVVIAVKIIAVDKIGLDYLIIHINKIIVGNGDFNGECICRPVLGDLYVESYGFAINCAKNIVQGIFKGYVLSGCEAVFFSVLAFRFLRE